MSKFDLGAFLAPEGAGVSESDTMREIPVENILDNPRNFYPRPDNAALAALMESIEANGLLEPPTVVPAEDGKYRLISGHSRMTALRLLAASKDAVIADRFARIPCRVLPPMTPAQEECAVIEANRQRIKTPALLAQEAERLTEMYVKRREAGEELPGRIRDRVAEALQVSKTKVANLSAIRNGLRVPAIRVNWERGLIPEAAALLIARMSLREQHDLWEWMVSNHKLWTINNVQEFEQSCKQSDEPAPSAADKRDESKTVIDVDLAGGCGVSVDVERRAVFWYPASVKPAEGAHIVYIDDCGIADEGIYRDCLIDNGNGADWDEVELWTLFPSINGGAG